MNVQLAAGTNPVTVAKRTTPDLTVDQLRECFGHVVATEGALAAAKADAEAKISDVLKYVSENHSTGPFLLQDGREVFIGNHPARGYFLKVRSKEPKPITAL